METKSPLLSKTLWVNFIMAMSALFIPAIKEWMVASPDMVAMIFSGVNMLLRLVTKQKLGLSE